MRAKPYRENAPSGTRQQNQFLNTKSNKLRRNLQTYSTLCLTCIYNKINHVQLFQSFLTKDNYTLRKSYLHHPAVSNKLKTMYFNEKVLYSPQEKFYCLKEAVCSSRNNMYSYGNTFTCNCIAILCFYKKLIVSLNTYAITKHKFHTKKCICILWESCLS